MSEISQYTTIPWKSLLWRTRGRRWDHAFLLTPQIRPVGGWYTAYKEIVSSYGNLSDGKICSHIISIAGERGQEIQISVANIEDTRFDAAGRPIRHTFFYVLNVDDEQPSADKQRVISSLWPTIVWNKLEPMFAAAYDADAEYQADLGLSLSDRETIDGIHLVSKPTVILDVVKLALPGSLEPQVPVRESIPAIRRDILSPSRWIIGLIAMVAVAGAFLRYHSAFVPLKEEQHH